MAWVDDLSRAYTSAIPRISPDYSFAIVGHKVLENGALGISCEKDGRTHAVAFRVTDLKKIEGEIRDALRSVEHWFQKKAVA